MKELTVNDGKWQKAGNGMLLSFATRDEEDQHVLFIDFPLKGDVEFQKNIPPKEHSGDYDHLGITKLNENPLEPWEMLEFLQTLRFREDEDSVIQFSRFVPKFNESMLRTFSDVSIVPNGNGNIIVQVKNIKDVWTDVASFTNSNGRVGIFETNNYSREIKVKEFLEYLRDMVYQLKNDGTVAIYEDREAWENGKSN